MKLQTEEQLHNTVVAVSNYLDDINLGRAQEKIEKHLKALTPIELPSDEEIEKAANSQSHYEGAMWLKYKILNQNKQL